MKATFFLAFSAAVAAPGISQRADEAPSFLREAKAAYTESVQKASELLLSAIEQQIQAATRSGDLDGVKSLMHQRDAFKEHGQLPVAASLKSAVATYSRSVDAARKRVIPLYERAIRELTREQLITAATALDKELKALRGDTGPTPIARETFRLDQAGRVAIFLPGEREIACASPDKAIRIWDIESRKEVRSLTGHTDAIVALALSPDETVIASAGSGDKTIRLWDFKSGQAVRTLRHSRTVTTIAFSPSGGALLAGGFHGRAWLWNTKDGGLITEWDFKDSAGYGVAFAPNGKFFLNVSGDHQIQIYDALSLKQIGAYKGHTRPVNVLAISPDSRWAISGAADSIVRLWDLKVGTSQPLEGIVDHATALAFSTDGSRLLCGSADGFIGCWEVPAGKLLYQLDGHRGRIGSVAFSKDGRLALTSSSDGTTRIWELPVP